MSRVFWLVCALGLTLDVLCSCLRAALVGLSRGVPTCDRDLCRGSAVAVRAGDLFGIGLAGAEGGVVRGDGGRRCQLVSWCAVYLEGRYGCWLSEPIMVFFFGRVRGAERDLGTGGESHRVSGDGWAEV